MVTQLCFLYLGFKFTPDSISANNVVQTWHRIIEAVKFGYAYRPFLGDPDFHQEVEEVGNVHISRILAFFDNYLRQSFTSLNRLFADFVNKAFKKLRKQFSKCTPLPPPPPHTLLQLRSYAHFCIICFR